MNVGKWYVLGLAIVVVAAAGRVARAEEGRPSRQTLSEMGLGSLVVMSDDDASAVRGMGFRGSSSSVKVWGSSSANIDGDGRSGAQSRNGYFVSGKYFAAGANASFAGVVHVSTGGGNGGGMDNWTRNKPNGPTPGGPKPGGGINVHATVFFAGGFSVGAAH